jgi:ADP-ribosylglycohydrolase
MSTQNKLIGSLVGLATGDAFGAPYEFKRPPFEVNKHYSSGGVHNVKPGQWTDDTSMALCIAQSLIENKSFDAKDQMDKYVSWCDYGYMSSNGECFDIGNTVAGALDLYKRSKNPFSGLEGDEYSGNGSLMRLAPIAIAFYKDKEKLIEYVSKSSQTTHKSQLCIDSCIYFAQLLKGAYEGFSKEELLDPNFINTLSLRQEVKNIANGSFKEEKGYKPTGYVIDTLESALMTFYKYDSFEDGLFNIVAFGYDTDTAGAVYGQIAGAYYGLDNIPKHLVDNLMHKDTLLSLSEKLCNIDFLNPKTETDNKSSNFFTHLIKKIKHLAR